jgi:O-phospho-L-seryl-tRNASec:L-selenocysteinyl-tRNA synthase
LVEPQPKAVGSSLVNKLTNALALDAIKICGITSVQNCFVAPIATGMALSLVLSTLRHKRPSSKYVIWSRIDQKSCIKAVQLSGFTLKVVDTTKNGDELNTDVSAIEQLLTKIPLEEILCVITTTSCFAPRAFDDIISVSELCVKYDIPHLVNNAYGLQSSKCCHLIQTAAIKGRVDAFVQSTDKNFMVPVGGSIIAGFDKTFIDDISKFYPGRASASPSLDLLITLLSVGKNKFKTLLNERKENFEKLKSGLKFVAEKHGERVLETKGNNISLALSLSYIKGLRDNDITELGAWLFQKRISGCRVIDVGSVKDVAGVTYQGWGSHNSSYSTPYLTVAAGIGMEKEEIDVFLNKLDTTLSEWKKKGQVKN